MWYFFCYLEVLFESFVWKLLTEALFWKIWLEALNRYVIFILLLCEYLIETFFVLKYVAWYFYMWYTELVCLFEYWVCIFVLVIFHWACCQYCWFCVFAVLVISVRLGILCTTTWKCRGEYWNVYWNFFFELICYSWYFYCVLLCYTNFILCCWQNQCVFVV